MDMYEGFESIFGTVILYCIMALEAIGAIIILISAAQALYRLVKGDHHGSKIMLSEGITTALSFLLGSEVLKTLIAPDWRDLGMTCAILLMRAAMTVLLHWEKKMEEKEAQGKHK